MTGLPIPTSQTIVQCTIIVCTNDLIDLTNRIVEVLKSRVSIGKIRSRSNKPRIRLQGSL